MRKIIVLNQKGGVGKTTTVANLAACLAELGRKVLMVDVDPQANLSIHFGFELARGEPSLYTLVTGEHGVRQVVRPTSAPGLGIIPSNIDMAGLAIELAGQPDRLFALRKCLDTLPDGFDYVLMDSPEEGFSPLQTEFVARQGLGTLVRTVELVRAKANPALAITGVLPCMHDKRTCLAHEILHDIRKHFGPKVFHTVIRKNVRLAEAPGFGLPVTQYEPECNGAADYRALAGEVVAMERGAVPTGAASGQAAA